MNVDAEKGNLVFEDYDAEHSSFLKLGGNSNSKISNGSWTDEVMKEDDSQSESRQIEVVKDHSIPDESKWSI